MSTQAGASNFLFTRDAVVAKVEVEGVEVSLWTVNIEPWSTTSVRGPGTYGDRAVMLFAFSKTISEFRLVISRVRADENLSSFSIGAPTELTGDLVEAGGTITTSATNDYGAGALIWTGLDTDSVLFDINASSGGMLGIDEFSLTPTDGVVSFMPSL